MPEKCHKVTFRILVWWYGGSVGSAVTSQHEDPGLSPRRPFVWSLHVLSVLVWVSSASQMNWTHILQDKWFGEQMEVLRKRQKLNEYKSTYFLRYISTLTFVPKQLVSPNESGQYFFFQIVFGLGSFLVLFKYYGLFRISLFY